MLKRGKEHTNDKTPFAKGKPPVTRISPHLIHIVKNVTILVKMQNIASILIKPFRSKRAKVRSKAIGWLALVIMILAGSTYTSFGKQLTTVFSPLSMLFVSEVMMLVFATISFGIFPILKKIISLKKEVIIPLFSMGVLNGIAAPFLWFHALSRTTAVNAELFGRSEMLFLIVLSSIFLHQQLRKEHAIGGTIIIFGLMIVTMRGFSHGLIFHAGDLIVLLSAMLYACGGILVRLKIHHVDPEVLISVRAFSTLLFFFMISPFIEYSFIHEAKEFPLELIGALIGFGLISRFLAMFTFYETIERLPIPTISMMATLTTAGSATFAFFYLGEMIHWYQALGALLIIFGAIYVHLSGLHRKEKHMEHHLKTHHRHHI